MDFREGPDTLLCDLIWVFAFILSIVDIGILNAFTLLNKLIKVI